MVSESVNVNVSSEMATRLAKVILFQTLVLVNKFQMIMRKKKNTIFYDF